MGRISSQGRRGVRALVLACRAPLGLALLALLSACGGPATAVSQPAAAPTVITTTGQAVPAAKPAATATATHADPATPTPAIAFPQFVPVAGERGDLAALLEGTLVLVDGCLRVARPSGATSYLVVWPPEVALRTDGGDVRVVDATGRVVARVGERVALGGGEAKAIVHDPRQPLREAPPAHCPGPYWTNRVLATVRAATPTPTRSPGIAFPQLADERVASAHPDPTARLDGTLTLVDGCLRVAGTDGVSYLVVWPADVALRTNGDIRVVYPDGRVVARVGERVTLLRGRMAEALAPVADAGGLREAPPARCPGPYWLAGRASRE